MSLRHKPLLAQVDELKKMIVERGPNAPPVVLLGFSAGSYMTMTVAMELYDEGFQ